MKLKRSVHFGAGNTGRGLVAPLLVKSGYRIVFTDDNDTLVDNMDYEGGYIVHQTDGEDINIYNVSAYSMISNEIVNEVAVADLITITAEPRNLKMISIILTDGIYKRKKLGIVEPLNILICGEPSFADELKEYVYKLLDDENKQWVNNYIGFVGCVVDRFITNVPGSLDLIVEPYYDFNIDYSKVNGYVGLNNVMLYDNIQESMDKKTYIRNIGYWMTAYFGYMNGKLTISESIADKEIRKNVMLAMKECGYWIENKYDHLNKNINEYIIECIDRFDNPDVSEIVDNIGENPVDKLQVMIQPVIAGMKFGYPIDSTLLGIASVFHYNADAQGTEVQVNIRRDGITEAIKKFTGIKDAKVIKKIEKYYLNK